MIWCNVERVSTVNVRLHQRIPSIEYYPAATPHPPLKPALRVTGGCIRCWRNDPCSCQFLRNQRFCEQHHRFIRILNQCPGLVLVISYSN